MSNSYCPACGAPMREWPHDCEEMVYIHARMDCPFAYCDQAAPFTACQVICRHRAEQQPGQESQK